MFPTDISYFNSLEFDQSSKVPVIKGLWEKVVEKNLQHIESVKDGLERVRNENKHAFFIYREIYVQNHMVGDF